MLPKTKRVSRTHFNDIFERGVSVQSALVSARVLATGGTSKYSFVVPKRVAHAAVARNRLRRRGYAIVEKLAPRLKKGFSTLFIFKKQARDASYDELTLAITALLEKTKQLTP